MSKTQAEELKKINIFWLKKNGYLNKGQSVCSGQINWKVGGSIKEEDLVTISVFRFYLDKPTENAFMRLQYARFDPQMWVKEPLDYIIHLTTTSCNYGSKRYWFICPLSKNNLHCGRRSAVLYVIGKYFGCRKCAEVSYASQVQKRSPRYKLYQYTFGLDQLERKAKRHYYCGRPTRKYRRVLKLNNKFADNHLEIERFLERWGTKI